MPTLRRLFVAFIALASVRAALGGEWRPVDPA